MMMLRLLLLFALLVTSALSEGTVRYGYDIAQFGRFNKKDTRLAVSIWLQEIASGSGYDIKSIPYENMEKMARDLKEDRLDLVTTSAFKFVKYFDQALLKDGFSGKDSDSSANRLYLVVRTDRDLKGWKWLHRAHVHGLKGSDISRLYLDTLLLEHSISDRVIWIDTKNYQQALLRLFFGKGDAVIVTRKAFELAIEMNPQVQERLKVYDKSRLTDVTPSFFRKGADRSMIEKMIHKALSLSGTPRGKQLLEVFRSDSVIKVTVKSLLPVERAYDTYMNSIKKERR